jgi:small conductance mechanosensitive channel
MTEIQTWITTYGFKVLGAVLILLLGLWTSKILTRLLRRLMTARAVEPTLVSFSGNLAQTVLVIFVVIAALSQLGFETNSLIAVLGAAGLAIGLALQASLSNLAAGVMILLFRPFKAGDYIEGAGVAGEVDGLHLFTTRLKTPDNKIIYVPNGKLMNDNITNFSRQPQRRMDLIVAISYSADLALAKEVLWEILRTDPRVLPEPAPRVAVLGLADSSVNLAVRPYIRQEDYLNFSLDIWETIKLRFDAAGIGIPFPQRDVYLHRVSPSKERAA